MAVGPRTDTFDPAKVPESRQAVAAGGLDRTLKTNTSPKRQMSLYNQGTFWFRALPNMHEEDTELLLPAFDEVIREHKFFRDVYGVI